MNVEELYSLTQWIQTEIVSKQVPQKYQNLYTLLYNNSQSNSHQPFEIEKEDLLNILGSVRLAVLTQDQVAFLSRLGIERLLGVSGKE